MIFARNKFACIRKGTIALQAGTSSITRSFISHFPLISAATAARVLLAIKEKERLIHEEQERQRRLEEIRQLKDKEERERRERQEQIRQVFSS